MGVDSLEPRSNGPSASQGHRPPQGSTVVAPTMVDEVMAVKKISVALDPDVAEAAASAADAHGQSLSAWLNDAARSRLVIESGRQAVAEWQTENGELDDEERATAEVLLDDLLGAARRRSA